MSKRLAYTQMAFRVTALNMYEWKGMEWRLNASKGRVCNEAEQAWSLRYTIYTGSYSGDENNSKPHSVHSQ